MYVHEYIRTTITDSLIPVSLRPTEAEVVSLAKSYITWSISACEAVKNRKFQAEGSSNCPNIPLIALDFFNKQKGDEFNELDGLIVLLNEIRSSLAEAVVDPGKVYKTKEGVVYFLETLLPKMSLSTEVKIIINAYILSQSAQLLPERLRTTIRVQLTSKISKDIQLKIQELAAQYLPRHEARLLSTYNVKVIDGIAYLPHFFEVKLALAFAKAHQIPLLTRMNKEPLQPYALSSTGQFAKIKWESLDKKNVALLFEIHHVNDFKHLHALERLLLADAAAALQYPKIDNSPQKISSFTEELESNDLSEAYKDYKAYRSDGKKQHLACQVKAIRAGTISTFLKETVVSVL